jgi:hypothetical protein
MMGFNGSVQSSLVLHAAAPIEAVEYTPAWAACSFRTAARPRYRYDDGREIDRPMLTLSDPQSLAPLTCAKPYVPPVVTNAVQPTAPRSGMTGLAKVAVVLDEQGAVQQTHVVLAPGPDEGRAAEVAARHSTFAPAVFRCKPISSGYEFAVEFSDP